MTSLSSTTFQSRRLRLASIGVVALLAATLTVAANAHSAHAAQGVSNTPAAEAAATSPPCDLSRLCLYELPDRGGEFQHLAVRAEGMCVNVKPSLKSQVSSMWNRTELRVYLYAGDDCTGEISFIEPRAGFSNLKYEEFDDKLRSVRFGTLPNDCSEIANRY